MHIYNIIIDSMRVYSTERSKKKIKDIILGIYFNENLMDVNKKKKIKNIV